MDNLRHTNATLMLKANIPAKIASQRLGHSNIGITMDLYSHVINEMQENATEKLEIIFKWLIGVYYILSRMIFNINGVIKRANTVIKRNWL